MASTIHNRDVPLTFKIALCLLLFLIFSIIGPIPRDLADENQMMQLEVFYWEGYGINITELAG
jgi:hypothetical protein